MNKITDQTIQDLKQANVIEVVGAFLTLKKQGTNHLACCPFHDEKTPSFCVKHDMYKCFGCGVSGDAVQFVEGRATALIEINEMEESVCSARS